MVERLDAFRDGAHLQLSCQAGDSVDDGNAIGALRSIEVSDEASIDLDLVEGEALNNMGRGLSLFDSEAKLIVCNKLYREIYSLPEALTRPGTHLAEIVRNPAHHNERVPLPVLKV